MQAGRGKSGETARGCFEYIRKRGPLLWMVENAKALSNMPGAKHGAAGSASQGFALGTTGSVAGSAKQGSALGTTGSAGHAQKSDLQHLLDLANDLGYVAQAPARVLSWARRPTAGLWARCITDIGHRAARRGPHWERVLVVYIHTWRVTEATWHPPESASV